MKKYKSSIILMIVGFVLVYQFLILRMLGLIHLTSEWQWSSDLPAMTSVLGTLLVLIGLIKFYKDKKKFKNSDK